MFCIRDHLYQGEYYSSVLENATPSCASSPSHGGPGGAVRLCPLSALRPRSPGRSGGSSSHVLADPICVPVLLSRVARLQALYTLVACLYYRALAGTAA